MLRSWSAAGQIEIDRPLAPGPTIVFPYTYFRAHSEQPLSPTASTASAFARPIAVMRVSSDRRRYSSMPWLVLTFADRASGPRRFRAFANHDGAVNVDR